MADRTSVSLFWISHAWWKCQQKYMGWIDIFQFPSFPPSCSISWGHDWTFLCMCQPGTERKEQLIQPFPYTQPCQASEYAASSWSLHARQTQQLKARGSKAWPPGKPTKWAYPPSYLLLQQPGNKYSQVSSLIWVSVCEFLQQGMMPPPNSGRTDGAGWVSERKACSVGKQQSRWTWDVKPQPSLSQRVKSR